MKTQNLCFHRTHVVQEQLRRKAESANGSFQKFSTKKTALSQTHLDGTRIKKSLSQRVHYDVTGIVPHHRDIWSSFLARYVNQDELSLHDAQLEYQRLESVLLEAWQQYGAYKSATQVRGTAPHQQLASGVAQKCGLGGFPHEQLLQDGESETLRSDSSAEQVSIKLESISQISREGLKANVSF